MTQGQFLLRKGRYILHLLSRKGRLSSFKRHQKAAGSSRSEKDLKDKMRYIRDACTGAEHFRTDMVKHFSSLFNRGVKNQNARSSSILGMGEGKKSYTAFTSNKGNVSAIHVKEVLQR
mmetsp:Transcript_69431/g.103349  ORF Transcript_69431/g.103349 Transcript_69431/m.103349 type:complete len:118 (-) Transcript_69431:1228-1581(-)